VNGQKCPSAKTFSGKFPEEPSSRRRWCDFGRTPDYVPEEHVPECFRKKVLPEDNLLPEDPSSGNCFFFLNDIFCNYLILMNKFSYKINNIIIHK